MDTAKPDYKDYRWLLFIAAIFVTVLAIYQVSFRVYFSSALKTNSPTTARMINQIPITAIPIH